MLLAVDAPTTTADGSAGVSGWCRNDVRARRRVVADARHGGVPDGLESPMVSGRFVFVLHGRDLGDWSGPRIGRARIDPRDEIRDLRRKQPAHLGRRHLQICIRVTNRLDEPAGFGVAGNDRRLA